MYINIFLAYLIFINVIAVYLTVKDKLSATKHKGRVKESTLIFTSIIGGAVAMYFAMLFIRHKTKKVKFMLSLPLIIILQLIAFYVVLEYV